MRSVVRSLRQLRRFTQHHAEGHSQATRLFGQQNALIMCGSTSGSLSTLRCNGEISRFASPGVELMRSMFSTVVTDPIKDIGRGGPMVEYERRIASGELVDGDSFQVDTIQQLQRLYEELIENEEDCQLDRYKSSEKSGRPFNWRKKRIHFHDFMLNVHSRLQMHKGVSDPLDVVAAEISDEAIILCLDEFMVTDVADAMILNRLFRQLFSKGVILVSTSNRAPDKLYEGGLQRDLFLPFIDTLKERCIVHAIGSAVDYRQLGSAEQGFYFVGKHYSTLLKQKLQSLIGDEKPSPQTVEVIMGRKLQVPLGANGCAYFPFEDLCDKPLGAADYFGLFKKFHTLALDGIPKLGSSNRTAAYRFVTLIDVMYENKARLLCTAEAGPVGLFENIVTVAEARKVSPRSSRSQKSDDTDLCVDNELGFAKDRTISRLTEINSREYLEDFEMRLRQQQQLPLQGLDKRW
ncbi:uncharacterized protein [Zea mays]|uniref:AFG1-like ATPase family protein n=1 Tax=Zea mays TaxID=4577 RepID=A0A804MDA2_MAIZE|nr:uncharacterized protein LOC100191835 isoform X2 [Zea mays]|eukprot:XP_020402948.1 AFG1-like ATPase family protein isoform X2 [Zea mays]